MSNTTRVPTQVAAAVPGITYRQLDYWTRRGYLNPPEHSPGPGYARVWPRPELAVAAVDAISLYREPCCNAAAQLSDVRAAVRDGGPITLYGRAYVPAYVPAQTRTYRLRRWLAERIAP